MLEDEVVTISFDDSSIVNASVECTVNENRSNEGEQSCTIYDASFNFINSIVGAGIIGIPYAMKQCGLLTGILMLTFIALLVDKSVLMLIECGIKNSILDLEDLTEHLLGKSGYYAALFFMFLFSYGAQIAYLVVLGDTVPLVIETMFSSSSSVLMDRTSVMVISSVAVILPLCFFKNYGSLAWTSLLSIILDFTLILIVMIAAPITASEHHISGSYSFFVSSELFAGIGAISFAFVCQHNSFIVFKSLKQRTFANWKFVAHGSIGFSYVLCLGFGLSCFLSFKDTTEGDVLNNFPTSDTSVNAARSLLAITMLFTYPMESFIARHCIMSLTKKILCTDDVSNNSSNLMNERYEMVTNPSHRGNPLFIESKNSIDDSSCSGDSDGLNEYGVVNDKSSILRFIESEPYQRLTVTLLLFVSSLTIAIVFNNFGVVLSITGALAASMLGFVLPAVIYIKTYKEDFDKFVYQLQHYFIVSAESRKFLLPIFMIMFGFVALVAGLSTTIYYG